MYSCNYPRVHIPIDRKRLEEYKMEALIKKPDLLVNITKHAKDVFQRCQTKARLKKHITNELTVAYVNWLVHCPCLLCGKPGTKNNQIGIDRAQNALGYTYENSQPAHKKCNFNKSNLEHNAWVRTCTDVTNHAVIYDLGPELEGKKCCCTCKIYVPEEEFNGGNYCAKCKPSRKRKHTPEPVTLSSDEESSFDDFSYDNPSSSSSQSAVPSNAHPVMHWFHETYLSSLEAFQSIGDPGIVPEWRLPTFVNENGKILWYDQFVEWVSERKDLQQDINRHEFIAELRRFAKSAPCGVFNEENIEQGVTDNYELVLAVHQRYCEH